MTFPRLSQELAAAAVVAVDAAQGSINGAAKAMGLKRATLKGRLRAAEKHYGLVPAATRPSPDHRDVDEVERRRLLDRIAARDRVILDLQRRVAKAEDLKGQVFGLIEEPLQPIAFPRLVGGRSPETIVLFLSDLHWGERIDLAAMDGLNSYNLAIARARLARWTATVIDLATKHWSGAPPQRVILILGGDLVSGEIHDELAKTNEAKALPAVRDLVGHLKSAIDALEAALPCPIDIISLPGNHGRSTRRPEAKEAAITSYDTLVSDFLRMALLGHKRVTFHVPPSGDALFSVYGWRVFATHGDRIGSRGGQGFIGPAATAARGMKRIIAELAARGVHLDLIVFGHLHTGLQLEEGLVNDCLSGPSEYGRDGRFRPHPATQLFFTMTPRRRLAQIRWIEVGHPDEGALYAPPPEDRPLRPRYRVPAVMKEA